MQTDLFAGGAEGPRVNRDASEPERGSTVGGLGHERDARKFCQRLAIECVVGAALGNSLVEALKLAAADGGEEVAEADS